jgi:glucose/arabinose dehydrogenase
MPLNSSKFIILTLLVIFIAGCAPKSTETIIPLEPTQTPKPSATVPITPFPTEPPATLTPTLANTAEVSASLTLTATTLPANVAVMPNPEKFTWEVVVEGFTRPTGLAAPADGSNRLFVLEQAGLIYILQEGQVLATPFLDLRERASTRGSTVHGLLGLAFHPDYAENGYFFVHYTQEDGSSVIARYRASANPNLADPGSEERLLEISYPIGEHIGGGLAFGPDGLLYISIGDGAAGGNGDAAGNAQNPKTLLGSLLRLDVNHDAKPEVWAIGLRNPWRFSFDTLTGDLYIADVGENQWEEIDFVPAGFSGNLNFGWNFWEGTQPYKRNPPEGLEVIFPIWVYDHTQGCSITGGYVYRGKSLPEWFGVYLYGDYCTGNIWGLLQKPNGSWQNAWLYKIPAYITSFGQDQSGEIYLASITGVVYRLASK